MHIPDGFLTPPVWGTLDIVSASLVAVSLNRVSQHIEEKSIPLMGVLAAFIFAAQMVNLPIAGGTSAHFLGGTLIGILLGPWAGLLIMSVVLFVQCFLFQDGGLAALGTNLFNMGVIGSFGSALLFRGFRRLLPAQRGLFWAGFGAAWSSVVLSAVCCAIQLNLSGVLHWKVGLTVIVGVHAILGLLEGLVTGTILESLARRRPDLLQGAA